MSSADVAFQEKLATLSAHRQPTMEVFDLLLGCPSSLSQMCRPKEACCCGGSEAPHCGFRLGRPGSDVKTSVGEGDFFREGTKIVAHHCELKARAKEEEEVEVALVGVWEVESVRRWRRATRGVNCRLSQWFWEHH